MCRSKVFNSITGWVIDGWFDGWMDEKSVILSIKNCFQSSC
jgi:hypothetical protein